MPIKLHYENPVDGTVFISRNIVMNMVKYYRQNRTRPDGSSLKFVHFSALELIELLVANGVINSPLTSDQMNGLKDYGVKIYVANHMDDATTCPSGRPNYAMNDTVVVCTTQLQLLNGAETWNDLLVDGTSSVSMPGTGDGLDKGTICPPDCPGAVDPSGYQSVDIGSASI